MGIKYLNNKYWKDVTREERYFCSELFNYFKYKENELINFLNLEDKKIEKNNKINFAKYELEKNYEWELAYEVCFYRDIFKMNGKNVVDTKFSNKRTFDLCLFSNNRIIIIEAKAQGGFERKQLESISKDIEQVSTVIKLLSDNGNIIINTIALCSNEYIKNCRPSIKENFDLMISWKDIEKLTGNLIFSRANSIYKS